MIFDSPRGIEAVNIRTLGEGRPRIDLVVSNAGSLAVARKTREVYFRRMGALCAANLDTHAVREITKARALAVNCDETFVVTTITAEDPTGKTVKPQPRAIPPQRVRMFPRRTDLPPAHEAP